LYKRLNEDYYRKQKKINAFERITDPSIMADYLEIKKQNPNKDVKNEQTNN
jgi:hypothetical protein